MSQSERKRTSGPGFQPKHPQVRGPDSRLTALFLSHTQGCEDRKALQLSGLLAYRKPMKIPINLSPSPPLIDLSEANYEEIDSLIEKCPKIFRKQEDLDENVDIPEVAEIPR